VVCISSSGNNASTAYVDVDVDDVDVDDVDDVVK